MVALIVVSTTLRNENGKEAGTICKVDREFKLGISDISALFFLSGCIKDQFEARSLKTVSSLASTERQIVPSSYGVK